MEVLTHLFDLVIHLDVHLTTLLQNYGLWIYLILFIIIFCETGLVVTPFLPGDSLLFVIGALAATGGIQIEVVSVLLISAALCGDNTNYFIGRYLGPKVFHWEQSRWFNRKALDRTREFYERHGGKTLIIARFVPLVRTFAPFVAGVGQMRYKRYIGFCIAGAVLWVISLTQAGYWFGNIQFVKQNLTLVILIIIGLSLMPLVVEYVRHRVRS